MRQMVLPDDKDSITSSQIRAARILSGSTIMNNAVASKKLAHQLSIIRQRKITKIRAKIANGRYRIDNDQLARALFLAR